MTPKHLRALRAKAKRIRHRLHGPVLIVITILAASGWWIAAASLDSESFLPAVIWMLCTAWLALFAFANSR